MTWKRALRDLGVAATGAALTLVVFVSAGAVQAGPGVPPELRTGLDIQPLSPAKDQPPSGQIRQIQGKWVLIKDVTDAYYWINFDQVLGYKSHKR